MDIGLFKFGVINVFGDLFCLQPKGPPHTQSADFTLLKYTKMHQGLLKISNIQGFILVFQAYSW